MFHYKKCRAGCATGTLPILLSSLLFTLNVAAQTQTPPTPTPTPPPIPVVEKVAGQPITITWVDGRQAVLEATPTINERLPLPIELSENTCDSTRRVQCEYKAGLGISTYRLVWKLHPDPARVGKTVRMGSTLAPMMSEELVAPVTWTMVDGFLAPKNYKNVMSDEPHAPRGTG